MWDTMFLPPSIQSRKQAWFWRSEMAKAASMSKITGMAASADTVFLWRSTMLMGIITKIFMRRSINKLEYTRLFLRFGNSTLQRYFFKFIAAAIFCFEACGNAICSFYSTELAPVEVFSHLPQCCDE
mmetsp:Transcript_88566/g.170483  ORF Transcript_88566/g.170483 Transcript_88566/m.170483 type:complete len:127 (-) Transcript_88566:442-822(-)